jgi:superfamily II DNA or RNA helicase
MALRPHQQQAFDAAIAYLDTGPRVTVVLPCGTGKTLLGQRLADRQTAQRRDAILVVVPTVALLAQTLKAWTRHSTHGLAAFVFCHDTTLGAGDVAVPVSTSPAALADWVARTQRGPAGPQPVVFATYQSSPRVAAAHRDHALGVWGAIVADEAHCCAGQFEAAFATVVDNDKVPAHSRIFLTATPRVRTDTSGPAFCMDDPTSFGPIVAPLSVRAAIDAQLLSDYIVTVIAVTDDDVRAAITNPASATINRGEQSAEQVAIQLAVAAAARTYQLRRIMVFHNSVADSKGFTASLPGMVDGRGPAGELTSVHLDASTPGVERAAHLELLAEPGPGRWTVLSNVRCLGQGVDVPALDGVVFAGPRTSALDITQCVGRALRTNPDRSEPAVVVLPVFVDATGDLDEQVASSRWRHVYRTLLALADHDSELAGELARRNTTGGRSSGRGDASGHLVVLGADGTPGLEELHRALQLRALRLLTPRWDRGYAELQAYAERHGDARVPYNHMTATKFALGSWVRGNRRRRRELTQDQVDELESLAGWSWNLHETLWWEGFARLRDYIASHGHARINSGYRGPDGFALHQWAWAQRAEIAAGRLPADREEALRSLEMFSLRPSDSRWEAGIDALTEFVDTEGHASPIQGYVSAGGFRLGLWVHNVRRRRDKLDDDQIREVEAFPGWSWDPQDSLWRKGIAELAAYKERHGHVQVPRSYLSASGAQLGRWLDNQKTALRARRLTVARRQALSAVDPHWFTPQVGRALLGAPRDPTQLSEAS